MDSCLKEMFDHISTNKDKEPVHLILKAILIFYERNGCFPVSGRLPDMESDTENYIKLQRIFHDKMIKDVDAVCSFLQEILLKQNMSITLLNRSLVEYFCKKIDHMKLLKFGPVNSFDREFLSFRKYLAENEEETEWLLAFLLFLNFISENNSDDFISFSLNKMKSIAIPFSQKFTQKLTELYSISKFLA